MAASQTLHDPTFIDQLALRLATPDPPIYLLLAELAAMIVFRP